MVGWMTFGVRKFEALDAEIVEFMIAMSKIGNIKSMSDLQVGAKCLETGIWGCYQNVLINMGDIKDEAYKTEVLSEADEIVKKSQESLQIVLDNLKARKDNGEN